ncbi:dTDP-4-dehydrorhamnose 3,5-epimerase [Roseobacter denitrificans OCh 114]|uniref:dTDP-4-dehydrorhamnose 3,5-epimerase n=1 Tax=Roseobacter denitrificans (strain ATCC 33942 / OCh 114) TaxID=375451 RepID=Q07GH0_ROSDO|nr:dTDP-4-dehydrorhamnose 3,5-epimerase [Roseobacter denitrificans]ABI93429.1 dTDP-4-dehydrorhamnose 3,5-epimerase [Roseobacter denitrificans OCh 114]SFG44168.1 dTDP-4-dehydrorhamnose 3,5-epimerase [Roseobacter denitrificans OCh 114]
MPDQGEDKELQIEQTKLAGVFVLTPKRFGDARGFFSESWSAREMAAQGLDFTWVQDNHSLSMQTGTVRGLHFQSPPHAQAKLVRCGRGAFFDVAVDIRRGSPTYGQWVGAELSYENGKQMLVPTGFLHGFATRQPETEIIYKCSDYYAPECDGAVRFDCPTIGIDWGLGDLEPVLSDKDAAAQGLADFDSPFVWEGVQ